MKNNFNGSFEFEGIEYDYTAVIYFGDDSYIYPDQITDLDRTDGKSIADGFWEEVEMEALQNAYLCEWCKREGWQEEDTGNGCSALIKNERNGTVTRITKANDPGVPQGMGEPVVIGRYDRRDQLLGEVQKFKGGINEWLSEGYDWGDSAYASLITEVAEKLGRPNVNPRWVEAFMRLEYPSLNGVSTESFEREVAVAIGCIDVLGPKKSEQCAKSFGL